MGAGNSVNYSPTISVESIDTGDAINAEKLDQVAQPFTQENQTSRRVSQLNFSSRKQLEGYGGLATSKTALVGNGAPCDEENDSEMKMVVQCVKIDPTSAIPPISPCAGSVASAASVPATETNAVFQHKKKKYRHTAKPFLTCLEVPLIESRNLCQTEKYLTLHLELDISLADIKYEVADGIQILPENPIEDVKAIATLFEWSLDDLYDFEGDLEDFFYPFPSPFTLKKALTCYIDLMVC
jgi:sulfite reductase alpha subunit-like flavoprotein